MLSDIYKSSWRYLVLLMFLTINNPGEKGQSNKNCQNLTITLTILHNKLWGTI